MAETIHDQSLGLAVMVDDLLLRGCEFKSNHYPILHFYCKKYFHG